jgi:hypothetical protein
MKCGSLETVPFQSTVEQFDRQQQRQQRAPGHSNGEGIELGSEAMLAHSENRHRRAAAWSTAACAGLAVVTHRVLAVPGAPLRRSRAVSGK